MRKQSIRELASGAAVSENAETLVNSHRELRKELSAWRASLQTELLAGMEREIHAIEDRVSTSLLAEKQRILDSVESLQSVNAADPALVSLIQGALVEAEAQKTGRVDYAALANGASVIHTKRCVSTGEKCASLWIMVFSEDSCVSVSLLSSAATCSVPARFLSWRRSRALSASTAVAMTQARSRHRRSVKRHCRSWALCSRLASCRGGSLDTMDGQRPLSRCVHFFSQVLSPHGCASTHPLICYYMCSQETMEIGSCWGIAGSSGKLSVKFPTRIVADAITIDHIPERVASDFRSAPRDVAVVVRV